MSRNHHVVPRAYLKEWAVGEHIGMSLTGSDRRMTPNIAKAGVVRHFYRRFLPDGEAVDDVEQSLAVGEAHTIPALRQVREQWPLCGEAKAPIAEFLAVQIVRGSTWREFQQSSANAMLPKTVDEIRARWAGLGWTLPNGHRVTPDAFEGAATRATAELRGASAALERMLEAIEKVATVIAAMHWTLLEFDSAALITSDQPVVPWPADRGFSQATAWRPGQGLLPTFEIRFPFTPQRALLLSWLDEYDDEARVIEAPRSIARNLNSFTRAQAARQWFFVPGSEPEFATRPSPPVSPMLLANYDDSYVRQSVRRQAASDLVQPLIGAPSTGTITIIGTRRPKAPPLPPRKRRARSRKQ